MEDSDATGPSMRTGAYTQAETSPRALTEGGVSWRLRLFCDAIRVLPGVVLRGHDILPSFAAQDADEASHSVLLPARGYENLSPLARFINAITSAFLLTRSALHLPALSLFQAFGLRLGFGGGASVTALFSEPIGLVLIMFLPTWLR